MGNTMNSAKHVARLAHVVLLAFALTGCGQTAKPAGENRSGTLAQPSAEQVRAHMKILADDAMQGRETGTADYRGAAEYVAAQFAKFGLVALGDDGSFFQAVPFLSTRLVPESASLVIARGDEKRTLVFGVDFVTYGSFNADDESVTAGLVFVGYGINAPHYGHNDFAGLDCRGKILVRLTGAPPGFSTDERAYYSSSWVKNSTAVEQGAAGVITVRTPVDLPRLTWDRYLAAVGSSSMAWTDTEGRPAEEFPELRGQAVLGEAAATTLFENAGHDLQAVFARRAAGETGGFELGLTATLTRRSVREQTSSPNVIAMIPGADESMQGQYLLYTAHLDHLGIRSGKAGDDIHNGAYDNAAGVATMLEVARIMAAVPGTVRRGVVFAALTGEEKGLRGSSYLARHPPLDIDGMVAVINIDMPYLGFPIAEIMGLGVEHSSLKAALDVAALQAGLAYTADPRPELVRFIRSDQFSFVRRGVPGLNLKPGTRSSDPAFDGPAMHDAYLKEHYHQPSDDLELPFSQEGSERFARVALLLGMEVANGEQRPHWNTDDFFGQQFATDRTPH